MSWESLPTNYTDAVWEGLKKYQEIQNSDNTISFQDVTQYTNRDNSFFGASDANRMNEAMNAIMESLEDGTDLYEAFKTYFEEQKIEFETKEDSVYNGFVEYTDDLKSQGDDVIDDLKSGYRIEMTAYEATQKNAFNTWFDTMRGQLSDDAAGNLQNQVTELDNRLSALEEMTLQNDFSTPLLAEDTGTTPTLLVDDSEQSIVADWKYKEE